MWLLLRYLSNILGYLSKNWNYTPKTKLGRFLHSRQPPPQSITFLLFISQKILVNIKDVESDHSMGCIHVLFPFLWIINVLCTNFGFLKFWFYFFKTDIGFLWSKITIFILEITPKQVLDTKYGWNNPHWGRLGLKSAKFYFFAISGSSKFIANTNIPIYVTGSIFIGIRFFF